MPLKLPLVLMWGRASDANGPCAYFIRFLAKSRVFRDGPDVPATFLALQSPNSASFRQLHDQDFHHHIAKLIRPLRQNGADIQDLWRERWLALPGDGRPRHAVCGLLHRIWWWQQGATRLPPHQCFQLRRGRFHQEVCGGGAGGREEFGRRREALIQVCRMAVEKREGREPCVHV